MALGLAAALLPSVHQTAGSQLGSAAALALHLSVRLTEEWASATAAWWHAATASARVSKPEAVAASPAEEAVAQAAWLPEVAAVRVAAAEAEQPSAAQVGEAVAEAAQPSVGRVVAEAQPSAGQAAVAALLSVGQAGAAALPSVAPSSPSPSRLRSALPAPSTAARSAHATRSLRTAQPSAWSWQAAEVEVCS